MEAKDTVMTRQQRKEVIVAFGKRQITGLDSQENDLLQTQAEISFKAGQEQTRKEERFAIGNNLQFILDNAPAYFKVSKIEAYLEALKKSKE